MPRSILSNVGQIPHALMKSKPRDTYTKADKINMRTYRACFFRLVPCLHFKKLFETLMQTNVNCLFNNMRAYVISDFISQRQF